MVYIRKYMQSDFKILMEIRNDIALQKQLMAYPTINSDKDVHRWIDKRINEKNTIFMIIADKITDTCIGFLQLININNINKYGELGIAIHENYQNKGYGKIAIKLFIERINKIYKIEKVIIYVLKSNAKAISIYKKLSFTQCGLHKKHFLQDDKKLDVVIMENIINEK